MKTPTRKTQLILAAMAAAIICVFFLPFPLEGNWQTTTIGCACDAHHFLRFERGKVLSMSDHHPPPDWIGTYKRIGWGKYRVDMFLDIGSTDVRPKLLFLDLSGLLKVTWRDFAFWKTSPALRDPAQEWIQDIGTWNIVIRGVDGETRYLFGGREIAIENAKRLVDQLRHKVLTEGAPLVVYAGLEGIPPALLEILERHNLKYEERPNLLLHRTR